MKIKSLRLALEKAATRSTQPGRAPASIFETGSTRTKAKRRQRATHPQFQRPASAAPGPSKSLSRLRASSRSCPATGPGSGGCPPGARAARSNRSAAVPHRSPHPSAPRPVARAVSRSAVAAAIPSPSSPPARSAARAAATASSTSDAPGSRPASPGVRADGVPPSAAAAAAGTGRGRVCCRCRTPAPPPPSHPRAGRACSRADPPTVPAATPPWNNRSVPSRSHTHGDGSPRPMPLPRPQLPSARPPSELEAQQESRTRGAEKRNLWTTRAGNAPLWTTHGTPRFRITLDSGKSYFPHILLRRGHSRAQLLESESELAAAPRGRGTTRPPHRPRRSGQREQRRSTESRWAGELSQIFATAPEDVSAHHSRQREHRS